MNLPLKITPSVLDAIRLHARQDAPDEACGLILREEPNWVALPVANLSSSPRTEFALDPLVYTPHHDTAKIAAIYHSHVDESAQPSAHDEAGCRAVRLPYLIYSLKEDTFMWVPPESLERPYLGRSFRLGVWDCFSLVHDYYMREFHHPLPGLRVTAVQIVAGVDYHTLMDQMRLKKVSLVSRGAGDILLFSLQSNGVPNHCAICTGPGRMLHQLVNRQSCYADITPAWERSLVAVLRRQTV